MIDKDLLLKENLLKFFESKKKSQMMADVVDKKAEYSLRVIEWFVSSYSRKYKTKYPIKKSSGEVVMFDVYDSYKNEQLKSFSKKHFDLFRRSDKFDLVIDGKRSITTTVGQMNFFKWAIQNKILEYVRDNLKNIKKDMDLRSKKNKDNNKKKKFFDCVIIIHGKVNLSFD